MLTKRLIACFDVVKDRVTKAVRFQNNIDIADAVGLAKKLYREGIDELIFYDIKASAEKRSCDLGVIESVARQIFVPFTVGGGIRSVAGMRACLKAGAEKISLDSMAVRRPQLITEGARAFGSQCVVLSMQVARREGRSEFASGYEVAIDGARVFTGLDAVAWARQGAALGAGEIVVNSIDRDGTHGGYDLEITEKIAAAVAVPVVASGGAGHPEHLQAVFTKTQAQAGIISSMLYSPRLEKNYSVKEIKTALLKVGVPLRPWQEELQEWN